jgi:BASS family bile acid:Na+ symporter
LTSTAGGSVAYSVSLTTVATLLSPFTVPTVSWMVAGLQSEQALGRSALLLALLVALPAVIGYVLARRILSVRKWTRRFGSPLASVALLWIIATVVAANRDRLMDVGVVIVAALLLINLVGYASGYGVGTGARLPEGYRRALTLEVGMQNAGLGTALAASLYGPTTIATIPTAAYTFGCMLTGTVLAVLWRRRLVAESPPLPIL